MYLHKLQWILSHVGVNQDYIILELTTWHKGEAGSSLSYMYILN